MPQKLLDFGVITVRPLTNRPILRRIEKFIAFHQPKVVIIRDAQSTPQSGKRVQRLTDAITTLAGENSLPVYKYSREQIRDVFENFGVRTKHEIVRKIIEWFPDLASLAPKIRNLWSDEDYTMSIFDALMLAITHEYLGE
jgi:Holliday junction resolvasome RuvABC endonuclease subunit